jgi:hypothetical protein
MVRSKSVQFVKAISCLLIANSSLAQSFSADGVKLYDYFNRFFTQEIPITVKGLPEKMDTLFGLHTIRLTLHHNRVSDLKIQLQSPDGSTVWVTNRNGGVDGKHYINTSFQQFGEKGLINNAAAPFTGDYTPDGEVSVFNNGSNPNGEWKLLVEDLKEGEEGFLDSISISFDNRPAFIRQRAYCNFDNPELCNCNKKKNCELLPDLVILPWFSATQYKEFAWNDALYPGQLKVAVAIANIGDGPLEVVPDTLINATCCNGGTTQKKDERYYNLYQNIFAKNGNVFLSKKNKAGTIYFESKPGHQHYHVDNWIVMRLIKTEKGKRTVACKGQKVSYCLFTNGMLYEKDSSSLIKNKFYGSDMPNFSLGNYFSCSLQKQGISVGGYDYYGIMYEGQYLQLPKGLKSGNYVLEIEVDPQHKYVESNKRNNTFSMPIKITKQRE